MIDLLRNRGLSSIVMGAVIVATVLVFVIQFNPAAGKKGASISQVCAARVRGTCIEPKDHKSAFLLVIPRDNSGARDFGRAKAMQLPQLVLDGLIERELLVSEAERIGLTVTDAEVDDALVAGTIRLSLPADDYERAQRMGIVDGMVWDFQRNRPAQFFHDPKTHDFIDQKAYQRQLKNLIDRSPAEFREQQEREILAAKMRDLIKAPVRVSEAEALESYVEEKSNATLSYVAVERPFVLRWLVATPTDAEVDAWAKEDVNAKAVTDAINQRKTEPGAIKEGHIRHILIKVAPTASAEEHEKAIEKLTGAMLRIRRGERFYGVAKDVSEDGSKNDGGDVGDKTDAFVVPFKKAADALKPGEITPQLVETQFGYHIIMRDDPARLEADIKRELYLRSRVDAATRDLATKISAGMKAGKTVDDVVKEALAGVKPLPLLGVTADPTLVRSVANADGGAAAATDAGAPATGDAGAPPKPAPKKELDPTVDPDRPVVSTSGSFNRSGGDPLRGVSSGDLSKLLDFTFAATSKDGDLYPEPIKTDGPFYVVQLKEHKTATREEFDKDRDVYMQTLLGARQAAALAIYMKRLKDASKADITRDDNYMSQYKSDGGVVEDEEP
jgi:peptidyl-prolyl cis-trans isomerase D